MELKSGEVKNIPRTARQLAAHANAARGETIVWIIGVNENECSVDGAQIGDFAEWISQIESWFNGSAPHVTTHVHAKHEGKSVLGIAFDTRAAPFVVRNPAFGKDKENVELEVPWRYGTRAMSARKAELVRILVPLAELPECELVDCELAVVYPMEAPKERGFSLVASVYIISRHGEKVIIPYRRCACRLRVAGDSSWIYMNEPYARHVGQSTTVVVGATEVVVDGAGMVELRANAKAADGDIRKCELEAAIEIGSAMNQKRVTLYTKLAPAIYSDGELPTEPVWIRVP
ncbi:hypothetical protein [Sorangium sp. So ce1024]|uniref:hypothetical protein n=1 Tax=Sorangium sp. So ce1024 TaxID=3133327 RepID=UPI003F0B674A